MTSLSATKKTAATEAGADDQDAGGKRQFSQTVPFMRSKGQHILKNPLITAAMVQRAGVKSTDTVLEIGPGTGNLTEKLLAKAKIVHAYEIDPRMAAELTKRFQGSPNYSKLRIVLGDAVKHDFPYFDVCVSNLPYQISSPFVLRIMQQTNYRSAVVMVQKEFADRLLARPGDKLYSRLSANVQLHCRVSHVMAVARNNFRPPPRVESAIVRLEPRVPSPPISFQEYDGLLRVLFARKNKTIGAAFKQRSVLQVLVRNRNVLRRRRRQKERDAAGETPPADDDKELLEEKEESVEDMAKRVALLLAANGRSDSRARQMDEDDLLRLLLAFQKEDIRFA